MLEHGERAARMECVKKSAREGSWAGETGEAAEPESSDTTTM